MSEAKIKKWRTDAGKSLAEAAALVGVVNKGARSTWRNWEIGKSSPSLEVINKIAVISEGQITFYDWLVAQRDYRARHGETERAAA